MDHFKIAGLNVQLNVWNCAEDFMRDVPAKMDVDILFLDIEMPDYNGIYVGEYIRNDINNDTMHIIYVSSKTNYAMELFKIHPYGRIDLSGQWYLLLFSALLSIAVLYVVYKNMVVSRSAVLTISIIILVFILCCTFFICPCLTVFYMKGKILN